MPENNNNTSGVGAAVTKREDLHPHPPEAVALYQELTSVEQEWARRGNEGSWRKAREGQAAKVKERVLKLGENAFTEEQGWEPITANVRLGCTTIVAYVKPGNTSYIRLLTPNYRNKSRIDVDEFAKSYRPSGWTVERIAELALHAALEKQFKEWAFKKKEKVSSQADFEATVDADMDKQFKGLKKS